MAHDRPGAAPRRPLDDLAERLARLPPQHPSSPGYRPDAAAGPAGRRPGEPRAGSGEDAAGREQGPGRAIRDPGPVAERAAAGRGRDGGDRVMPGRGGGRHDAGRGGTDEHAGPPAGWERLLADARRLGEGRPGTRSGGRARRGPGPAQADLGSLAGPDRREPYRPWFAGPGLPWFGHDQP